MVETLNLKSWQIQIPFYYEKKMNLYKKHMDRLLRIIHFSDQKYATGIVDPWAIKIKKP